MDGVITLNGRAIAYHDCGPADGAPVLWCHGGPGTRFEPQALAQAAAGEGFRLIGIDRPGYGGSTPRPGRTIQDWVEDGLAVADALKLDGFHAIGVSTGGAYALALAAAAPTRVKGIVVCCGLSDMRNAELKAQMVTEAGDIWACKDRAETLAFAENVFGADGSKMMQGLSSGGGPITFPESDLKMLSDPQFLSGFIEGAKVMFAHGVQGYADDRIADGVGWGSFDASKVGCPVNVIHGEADTICRIGNGHYTAKVTPGAKLVTYPELGHFSIMEKIIDALVDVRDRA